MKRRGRRRTDAELIYILEESQGRKVLSRAARAVAQKAWRTRKKLAAQVVNPES